ncbi:MAG: TRAP transporter small permease [Syntrophales bacterium]|nr:TRAP transporter small permease [Syntrophales bacterium]
MHRVDRWLRYVGRWSNVTAGVFVMAMMILTCADVVLRLFEHPIPGTYELVGFFGTFIASLSLAHTALERGHIAVDLLVDRLPTRVQVAIDGVGALLGSVLFAAFVWQGAVYALELRHSGEVSLTLALPVYPMVLGIVAGCALLTLVLVFALVRAIRRLRS